MSLAGLITINDHVTLTIEAGTGFEFGSSMRLNVRGTLDPGSWILVGRAKRGFFPATIEEDTAAGEAEDVPRPVQ